MPTNRTRTKRGRRPPLSGRQIEHLLWGWCLGGKSEYADLHPDDPFFPFRDDDHRREMWTEHREYILSLEGIERVDGVFGHTPLKKGEKPQAMKDYERAKRKKKGE